MNNEATTHPTRDQPILVRLYTKGPSPQPKTFMIEKDGRGYGTVRGIVGTDTFRAIRKGGEVLGVFPNRWDAADALVAAGFERD